MAYLPGLLALNTSLFRVETGYSLIVLYTDSFPEEGLKELKDRGIKMQRVPKLLPSIHKDYTNDVRFYDCWSKLTPFSLVQYKRVVQLDCDMIVLKNMDELMEMKLDPAEMGGEGDKVFAACHACVCNPLGKAHYPKDWYVLLCCHVPESSLSQLLTMEWNRTPLNCAYTTQHTDPDSAQTTGAPATTGLGIPNGGLQVINPSQETYNKILAQLSTPATAGYDFADQSLLGDLFKGRWVALPYVYNALKTMRWEGVHDAIWRDEEVKNVHYILSPKPWEEKDGEGRDPSHKWWWEAYREAGGGR